MISEELRVRYKVALQALKVCEAKTGNPFTDKVGDAELESAKKDRQNHYLEAKVISIHYVGAGITEVKYVDEQSFFKWLDGIKFNLDT